MRLEYPEHLSIDLSRRSRLAAILAAVGWFVLAYVYTERIAGGAAGVWAVVPVVVAACLVGVRGGLVAAAVAFPMLLGLWVTTLDMELGEWFRRGGGFAGMATLVFLALVMGRMSDAGRRLSIEVKRRRDAEAALLDMERRDRALADGFIRGQETQRRRTSEDVHDRIVQTLFAAAHQIEELAAPAGTAEEWDAAKKRSLGLVRNAGREALTIMSDLHPPGIDDLGIALLVEAEVQRIHEDSGLRTLWTAEVGTGVPWVVQVVLYRTLHEALANVRTYASSTDALNVHLTRVEHSLTLEVADTNPGFDAAAALEREPTGRLASIRWRARMMGGAFQVVSQAGQGTTLTVSVPLSA